MARLAFLSVAACFWLATSAVAQVGGVYIDSKGLLRHTAKLSPDERLTLLRADAVGSPSTKQLANGSPLRKVSLRRLERFVEQSHRNGNPLSPDVRFLAGMTRVQYIFFSPEEKDVILAGPAEGWKQLPTGEVVGLKSGRPVLHLDDLITALRYAFTEKNRPPFVGCSIDPTADGLRKYAAYLRGLGGRMDRSRLPQIFAGMEQAMGPQAVRVFGVEPSSRFALTLVAADYRLKRIAMAHDPSPVKQVVSYLDVAARGPISARQPQHRWWFLAEYDAVHHTTDRLAYELIGQGVKVATAPTTPGGTKNAKQPQASPAARKFSETVTKNFPQLAEKVPVFAELQNLIGLSVATELIAQRYYGEVATSADRCWKPTHFLDGKSCSTATYPVPKTVPSLASYRLVRGRQWLISVSGGVEINPTQLAGKKYQKTPRTGSLTEIHSSTSLPKTAKTWWWD